MLTTLHPVFGDLVVKGMVAFCFLFVLGLVIDALWLKRQARLMREIARGQNPNARRPNPLQIFWKRYGGRFALLISIVTITSIVILVHRRSVTARAGNQAQPDGVASYATNFQGDATFQVQTRTQQQEFNEANSSGNQTVPGNISLDLQGHQTNSMTIDTPTNTRAKSVGSSLNMSRGQ